jgi:hypothetical protein
MAESPYRDDERPAGYDEGEQGKDFCRTQSVYDFASAAEPFAEIAGWA